MECQGQSWRFMERVGGECIVNGKICPLVKLDARLEHKLKALARHHKIVENLKHEIKVIESEKHFIYSRMMGEKWSS